MRAVQVSERGVIERRINGGIDPSDAARGVLGLPPRRKLMRDEDAAALRIDRETPDRFRRSLAPVLRLRSRDRRAVFDRPEEGQEPEIHRAVRIIKGHGPHIPVVNRRKMRASPVEERGEIAHALGGVVVARDREDRNARRRQPGDEPVEERDGLRGRGRAVVDVPGDDHRGARFPHGDLPDGVERGFDLAVHGRFAEPQSDMQVGCVDEFHKKRPVYVCFFAVSS